MSENDEDKKDNFFSKLEQNIINSPNSTDVLLDLPDVDEALREKRQHDRFEFSGSVFIHCVDPSYSIKGAVLDINEVGGLGIIVENEDVKIGHSVLIEFVGGKTVKPFNLKAEVVNVLSFRKKYKIGLKIIQLSKVTLNRIKSYIDDKVQSDINWGK